jgi:uroporphyrin-III C-methyltransferase
MNGLSKGSVAQPGTVYLCGAGPGDPELLTLRAARLLASAEVVLPDDLVSDEILALANPQAEIIPVGKRCGQPRITQAGIHELMLLHGEEIDALTAAGISFEIVPGITTAFAVAASLKTPLTDRAAASKLILATAHHSASKPLPVVWEGAFPAEATLVLYMPGRDFHALAASLIASGVPPETPVAAVSRASTPHEQVTVTTVGELPESTPGPAPLLLLIGHAIRLP